MGRFAWLIVLMTSCSSASPVDDTTDDVLLDTQDVCPDETSPGCPPPDFDSR